MSHDEPTMSFAEFCFDLKRLRLSKGDNSLALKRQSAEVLALLLKASGQTVTREEIRNHVWHDRTIEFDDGINAAIRDIRQVLGDDSKSPRFVETLPRIGYRFIEPVISTKQNFALARLKILAAIGIVALGALTIGMATTFDFGQLLSAEQARLAIMPVQSGSETEISLARADEVTGLMVQHLAEGQQQLLIVSAGELFGVERPDPSMADLSRWLEVDYLLAGTLIEAEGVLSLNLRLVQTDGYVHIWSKTIPLEEGDGALLTPLIGEILSAIEPVSR